MSPVYDLPPPRNWQDFEDLCLDLFRSLWSASVAQKNGREFFPQSGVDVFGRSQDFDGMFGVQCKLKKRGIPLTVTTLEGEVEKAKGFRPKLNRFVLATTARCDGDLQQAARELSEEAGFEVWIYDWDHLNREIQNFPKVFENYYPNLGMSDPADLRSHYLRQLFVELDVVQVSKLSRSRKDDIALSKVYIGLDVTREIGHTVIESKRHNEHVKRFFVGMKGGGEALHWMVERLKFEASAKGKEEYSRLGTALEAVAVAPYRILLGRGGSGKSTFGRYLCLCLAGELLGHPTLNHRHLNGHWADEDPRLHPWAHGLKVPFFVELRRFVRSEYFPADDEEGKAQHLTNYLATLGPEDVDMGRVVRGALETGALVVLDGLDETPHAGEVRERLRQVIRGFVKTYDDCRVVVTSRPHAYEQGQDWRLDDVGFVEETLAPLDSYKIQRFVAEAYAEFAKRNRLERADFQRLSRDLLQQIETQKSLKTLAEQPLMLTMMIDLHTSRGGKLPGARSTLFEESVCLLFDRWNERRLLRSVGDMTGMGEEQIRSALELLAFRVHRDGGNAQEGAADVQEKVLLQALVDTRKRYGNTEPMVPEEICDHLNQRSGILIAESPSLYRFPHRYFQEYLAACHLNHFPGKRTTLLAEKPGLWRESILFLAGRLTNGDGIWSLLRELVPGPPTDEVLRGDLRFLRALFAGLAVREHRLWEREEADHRPKIEDIRLWMRRVLELGALEVKDRVQAGQVLGLLGDDRPGVGLGESGLPSFEWVEIPAGPFRMDVKESYKGSKEFEATVEAFYISRFPVTNAQFQVFVADGGYTNRWSDCWTEAGWTWRKKIGLERPSSAPAVFELPNHPRIGVSWYEALAFCSWLTVRVGVEIRLPMEAEWERAARGTDGREYPWGADFDASKCNTLHSEIGSTTAVGLFPDGESPKGIGGLGILDASGNVLEWCATQRREKVGSAGIDDSHRSASRAVRGGSFSGVDASCASQLRFHPDLANMHVGFRVATSMAVI